MWPYTDTEAQWLNPDTFEPETITPELVRKYMREAEQMRARKIAEMVGTFTDAIGRAGKYGFSALTRIVRSGADAHPPAGKLTH